MKSRLILLIGFLVCQSTYLRASPAKLTEPEQQEMLAMVHIINHRSVAYRDTALQRMLEEANYIAGRLALPTSRPISMGDVKFPGVAQAWFSVIRDESTIPNAIVSRFGTNIFNSDIPREQRLQSLEIGAMGTLETTNFVFYFYNGRMREVMRLSEHQVEYYAHDLDKLVGRPSLIDTNGAYQLATQWLAAADVDMPRLGKLKWTVNQLQYRSLGATNYVALPLYYVDFGVNQQSSGKPFVSVEVLGTTKELQDLIINDLTFSRRPLLIITNALELIGTPSSSMQHLGLPAGSNASNSPYPRSQP